MLVYVYIFIYVIYKFDKICSEKLWYNNLYNIYWHKCIYVYRNTNVLQRVLYCKV